MSSHSSSSSANPKVHETLDAYFPGAVTLKDLMTSLKDVLENASVDMNRLLFGISSCVDEINRDLEHACPEFGRPFNLGGLAGIPFVGTAGYSAFEHHVPDEGTVLIVFSSHVGIDPEGNIGKVHRHGMHHASTACGAAIGGLQTAWKDSPTPPDPVRNGQFVEIFDHLRIHIGEFDETDRDPDPTGSSDFVITHKGHVKLAKLISKKIEDDLLAIIETVEAGESKKPDWKPKQTVIVGGIQINLEPLEEEAGEPSAHKHWKKKSAEKDEQDYFLVTHVSVKNVCASSPLSALAVESLKKGKKNKKDKKDKKDKKKKEEEE